MDIIITGASNGIGLAEAQLLKTNRLFLIARDWKNKNNQELLDQCLIEADLTKQNDIETATETIRQKTRKVDVLINNVGVMVMRKFETMNENDIDTLIALNLRSHIILTHKLLPLLKESANPHIVFMSSMAAKSSIVGESVYAATKAGITNFANVLRNEYRGQIKVSVVHSWGVNTWNASAEVAKSLLQPIDIAETVEFIITREKHFLVESVDLGNYNQWRGGEAPWSPTS